MNDVVRHTLNGIDVDRFLDMAQAVERWPELGRFHFRAENAWISGGHTRSTVRGFYGAGGEDDTRTAPFVLDSDEPKLLLGRDHGASPVEYVLHALAACLTTTLAFHATARGIRLDGLEARLDGALDLAGFFGTREGARTGLENVSVVLRIRGRMTEQQRRELIELASERSPVFDIVARPVSVTVEVEDELEVGVMT
jgi:uncharacterized OsmC-like protein